MRCALLISVLIGGQCISSFVTAEEYRSAKGYTFQFPTGWVIASDSLKGNATQGLDQKQAEAVDVIIRNPTGSGNVTVGITNDPIKVSDQTESELLNKIIPSNRIQGILIKDIQVKQIQVGTHKALSATYKVVSPKASDTVFQQWQVLIPGADHTYIFTFTSHENEFQELRPLFEQMLETIKIPNSPANMFNNASLPIRNAVLGGLIVGALGGLVGGVIVVIKKKKK